MPTILFVDDEPHVLATFPRLFRRDPFGVVTARSAAEALAVIAAQPIDAVVTDHRMPVMLGAALLAELAQRAPHIGRILLTGDMGVVDDAATGLVAHELLRKPASADELRAAIASWLARAAA